MNTANLQLQGLLAVVSSLLQAIERKGGLTRSEIETLLDRAETDAATSARQHEGLSEANIEAVCFPARYLRQSMNGRAGSQSFAEVAMAVGQREYSESPGRRRT